MRPLTNLKPDREYKLPAQKMRSGFIGLYDGRFGSRNVLIELAYRLTAGAFNPFSSAWPVPQDDMREVVEKFCRDTDRKLVVHSVIRKNNQQKRLEFRTPIAKVFSTSLVSSFNTGGTAEMRLRMPEATRQQMQQMNSIENNPMGGGKIIPGRVVAETFNLPGKTKDLIRDCLLQLDATQSGSFTILWATWIISQEEAEYITNSSFVELRMSDVYPTLIDWTATVFGRFGRVPTQISKISKIATSVKATLEGSTVRPRTGVDDMVADIHGDYYVIPQVDQSMLYEQMLMDFGLQEDGTYVWKPSQPDENSAAGDIEVEVQSLQNAPNKKLPANMPIFSDWLNDKFVYSNTAGNLAVYDLSDTVPVGSGHLRNVLESVVTVDADKNKASTRIAAVIANIVNTANSFDRSILQDQPQPNDATTTDQDAFIRAIDATSRMNTHSNFSAAVGHAYAMVQYLKQEGSLHDADSFKSVGNIDLATARTVGSGCDSDPFRFIARMVEKATKVLANNVELLYTRMSVMSALQLLAVGNILVNHGGNYAGIKKADEDEREVYTKQGVDPDYKVQPIPLVKKDLLFQPHQAKVDNIMRGSPKNAAYPVDAGGGKTILIMTNILQEMKKGVCRKPIVACPSTLVGQYVEEVVFVTEGRLNILPITNATMRMHGEEKLKRMIENAPINTLVVTDFDFVKGRPSQVAYGNKAVIVWNNAEFLRQFEFDLIAVDESHKVKNLRSSRREALSRLMQDIPYKRLASGTLVDNTIIDLVSQVALYDPTIFGSHEKFMDDYASNTSGTRVLSWKPGAEAEIRRKIGQHVVFAGARRKEWAALLPPSEERFHAVDMTENQRLLYDSILQETTDLIEEAMAKNEDLREALESEDESVADDLEAMLRPYMIRLERYLSSPDTDEAASIFLKTEEDRVSPKVKKIYELCYRHLNNNYPGKILIFTNYKDSAEAVFRFAPPDLKKMMIHYTADNKMEARAMLSLRDDLRIMVGASSSMDTGLNFQHVSRLIRMETIWTPGLLEQGNSRINRPQLKKAELRTAVYFDWLMVNRTIDITKISRLVSKIVSKAKFDEYDSPAYQELPNLPVISMKLSSIRAQNDFQTELLPYLEGYQQYKQVQQADYDAYREENKDKLEPVPVPPGGLLEGSKLMSRVPYVAGMTIYGTDQLGLMRYDEFIHQDLSVLETEDTESDSAEGKDPDEDDNNPKAAQLRAMRAKWAKELEIVNGMPVHTEFGDGVIYNVRRKVWVQFNNTGERMRIPKLQVFVITRTTTNSKDMRNELMKTVGKIPLDAPIEVPVEVGVETDKRRKKQEQVEVPKDDSVSVALSIALINDIAAITFDGSDNDRAASALQNFGFQMSPDYAFARIKGPKIMLNLFRTWNEKKFTITRKTSAHLQRIYEALRSDRKAMNAAGFATQMDITHVTRDQVKPSADPFELKVYPRVENGYLYLMLPTKGQTANNKARRIAVPEVRWLDGGGESEYIRFCKSKADLKNVIKEIIGAGVTITNMKDLEKQFNAIRTGRAPSQD